MKPIHRGKIIAIEGIDGSGKTTLAQNLYCTLKEQNHACLLTQEPTKTHFGKTIRSLVSSSETKLSPKTEFLLFAADRAQHFYSFILPALAQGKIVISDRLSDSSRAYQGYGRGLDDSFIREVNRWAMENNDPDIVIYVKIEGKRAFDRVHERAEPLSSFEQEKKEFWDRVINGFQEIFKNQKHCITVDGSASPKDVLIETLIKLKPHLL